MVAHSDVSRHQILYMYDTRSTHVTPPPHPTLPLHTAAYQNVNQSPDIVVAFCATLLQLLGNSSQRQYCTNLKRLL